MSNYTITVDNIITQIWNEQHPDETHSIFESQSWSTALKDIDEKIEFARPYIFSFDYKCYGDDEDKKHLEQHILRKYFNREICCSSLVKWQMYLYSRLNDIMPKYNALYTANLQLIENAVNVLNPYAITESKDRNIDTKSTDTGKTSVSNTSKGSNEYKDDTTNNTTGTETDKSNASTKYSDTPQALMESDKDYLTNLTKVDSGSNNSYTSNTTNANSGNSSNENTSSGSTETSGTGTETKSDNYVKTIKGNMAKYNSGELLESYKNAIISIEELITNDLADLFYLIY